MAALSLKTRGELWIAACLHRFYELKPRRLEVMPPQTFSSYDVGLSQADRQFHAIPQIVWAYWNGSEPPLLIQRCFANWHHFNPGFSIRILDDASVKQYLPDIAVRLVDIPVAKRSDWIRLELLYRYGGIWLDASTVLTQSLDWVLEQQIRSQSEFVGYYIDEYSTDAACPVVESWFMAAPAGSAFIRDVREEFSSEVVTRTGSEYIEYLQKKNIYDKVRQKINMPEYLSIHLAMQVVLRGGRGYRLCLGKAEEGPFRLHVLGNWDRTPLKIRLMFSHIAGPVPALIKLRNPDRKRLDEYMSRGLYVEDSVVDRFLCEGQPQAGE